MTYSAYPEIPEAPPTFPTLAEPYPQSFRRPLLFSPLSFFALFFLLFLAVALFQLGTDRLSAEMALSVINNLLTIYFC
jgi:hypothetical protein